MSLRDIDNKKPEIYICSTNRSAGKTTYFSRLLVNRFINKGEKFALIYRFNYELDDCANKFFNDIRTLFFHGYEMTSVKKARGIYHELLLNEDHCGYALSLNSADQLKRYSHLFNDVAAMLFDEFQSETNHYCSGEVEKLISLHTSIARGQGKMSRYVPVYMLGNRVSLLNPYYAAMGIAERINSKTTFLKGSGFVLETSVNDSARCAQQDSQFNRAFIDSAYVDYMSSGKYLLDDTAFVENIDGKSTYVATLKYGDKNFAIREYMEQGVVYVDTRPDMSYPIKISAGSAEHAPNYVMLSSSRWLIDKLRYLFERGCFRFKNLECKHAIINALKY